MAVDFLVTFNSSHYVLCLDGWSRRQISATSECSDYTHGRLLAWKCVFSTQQCQLVGVMCIKFVNGEISLNGYHLTPSVAIWVQL